MKTNDNGFCSCGKVTYRSKGDAISALRKMHPKYKTLSVYKCPICNLYHIGHDRRYRTNKDY